MKARAPHPIACAWLLAVTAACSGDDKPTFARDIASILYESCAPCHRPGEPAPFSLLSYEDAFRKRRQIERVTQRRIMPPWLPSHGEFQDVGSGRLFRDDRRISDEAIATISAWVAAGAPRGEASEEPPAPRFPSGWQLREPDLILTATEAHRVAADGPDSLHNLVLLSGIDTLRYVEAVEIRPGNASVHHAILALDPTHESRRLDALDERPGYSGMLMGNARGPDGHFIGWTPGKSVRPDAEGMAWRLHPGHDLVLQLHLTPTGKEESVQPQIGLYFTDVATRVRPEAVVLYSEQIDIPAGVSSHPVSDHLTLPVPVTLHAVYPHAHYLCRRMTALAKKPDGHILELLSIDQWDFDWQDEFVYREAIELPAGTQLTFLYEYDNSSGNPANPNSPPGRVTFGPESADEMGTLSLTVTVRDEEHRNQLQVAMLERDLEKKPWDWTVLARLAEKWREAGHVEQALQAARASLDLKPDYAPAQCEVGSCSMLLGQLDKAERAFREAIRSDPEFAVARMHLGSLLARSGRTRAGIEQFTHALAIYPNLAALQNNMATALFSEGEFKGAAAHYRRAIALDPEYFKAQFNLGRVLAELGQVSEARGILLRALELRPGDTLVIETLERLR